MERYSWMILASIIAAVALIAFFYFMFKDMAYVQKHKKNKGALLLNLSLLALSAAGIVLAIYLYFDIQTQLRIFNVL